MQLWFPGAIMDTNDANDAGGFVPGSSRGVIHTTEGTTVRGARGAYKQNNSWPHFTVSYEGNHFRVVQHLPINRAARALRNVSGGVQTNRMPCVQIECVGFADLRLARQYKGLFVKDFPQPYLDGIAKLMRWVEVQLAVQRVAPNFLPYPESYGNSAVRMGFRTWNEFNGWCGHQHVPENLHGDPGNINIVYLLGNGSVVNGPVAKVTLIDTIEVDMILDTLSLEIPTSPAGQPFAGCGWVKIDVPRNRIKGYTSPGVRPEFDGTYETAEVGFAAEGDRTVVSVTGWAPGYAALVEVTVAR